VTCRVKVATQRAMWVSGMAKSAGMLLIIETAMPVSENGVSGGSRDAGLENVGFAFR